MEELSTPAVGRGLIGTVAGKLQNWSSTERHSRRGGDEYLGSLMMEPAMRRIDSR